MFEFTGLIDLPWWGHLLVALGLTHITIIGVTVFLHRHQAHRALEMHPAVSHFFRFWMWLTTGMATREWVAVHRKHHDKVEGQDDPHSPWRFGISKVLWEGSELYSVETACEDTVRSYGQGTPDDWLEHHVYAKSKSSGIVLMLLIDVGLFGWMGLTVWAVQMLWIPFFAAGVINGLGHWAGYRNFNTADRSTNLGPIGLLIGGEELHNNHHAYAGSARMSSKWWEFDAGWLYICVLERLGLARVNRQKLAPRPRVDIGKKIPDLDTVGAVLSSRLHVMSAYARCVMMRVHREELRKANTHVCRRRMRRLGWLLLRGPRLGSAGQRLLDKYPTLGSAYCFRQRLAELLQKRTNHEAALRELREWCDAAERTGIAALTEFAATLKGYTLTSSAT